MDEEIDLSIFELVSKPIKKTSSIYDCISIKRLLTALSYYDRLDVINNENKFYFAILWI